MGTRKSFPRTSTLVVSLVHLRLDYGNFVLSGLAPDYLQRRLKSVLNAAARPVFRLRALRSCYGRSCNSALAAPAKVGFQVAVMAFRVVRGLAPPYLNQLVRVADLPFRRRFRSSSTRLLHVSPYRLCRRSLPVAASVVWNSVFFYTRLPSTTQAIPLTSLF